MASSHFIKVWRKRWLCWRYGICSVHNTLRPHGGYNEGRWGICHQCNRENHGKNTMRNLRYEEHRCNAQDIINRDWQPMPPNDPMSEVRNGK